MILNPERGWSRWIDLTGEGPLHEVRAQGASLGFALVSLASYRQRPLDAVILGMLRRGFGRAREAGLKVVLRFAYATAAGEPDAPLERVLQHIAALAPLLADNADVLFVWQAGFIGAWGEWHSSTEGLTRPSAMRAVGEGLLAALPPGRFLQVRTPLAKQMLCGAGALRPELAHSVAPAARVGFHNDCVLSDAADAGTFRSDSDRRIMASDARFVPVGGETCRPGPRSAGPDVVRELARFGYTFLNGDYHPEVLAGWKANGVHTVVGERLGYLLTLEAAQLPELARAGAGLTVDLSLANLGFASPTYARTGRLVLQAGGAGLAAGARHEAPLPVDVRTLAPARGATPVTVALRAPEVPGDYHVGVALPDPAPGLAERPEYAMALAAGAALGRRLEWRDGVSWLGTLRVLGA